MRPPLFTLAAVASSIAALLAGCAACPVTPPEVPAALRAPEGQQVFMQAMATGAQIYVCAAKPDDASSFAWVFQAPEATLADRDGHALGKHYAGPTWESVDGSSVVGEVKARDAGPDKAAIPWLLLKAKSSAGQGVLTPTKSVQRVQTHGGVAPAEACTSANAQQVMRVPYTAVYYFYRAAP